MPSTPSNALARKFANGLTSLCLLMLCACSTRPLIQTKVEIQKVTPPTHLLTRTEAPSRRVETNADLVDALTTTRAALEACNADKAAILEWAAGDQ